MNLSVLSCISSVDVNVWCHVAPQVENVQDVVRENLLLVQNGSSLQLEEKEKNELKKRKLVSEV